MAATVYKGLTIQIGADTTKLTSALRQAGKAAEGTYKELRQINGALKNDPTNADLLKKKQELLTRQIAASTEKLEILKETMSQVSKEDITSEQWTQLISDISRTETGLSKLKAELAETARQEHLAASGANALGEKLDAAGDKARTAGEKIQGISGGVSNIGGALTAAVTMPIVAAGAATVKAATDIDSGLTSVKKTVDGTEEQYSQLKQAAIDFSKTNAVSAAQMLEIDALGAQLGFTIDELELFGQVASGLDIATDMDAEMASTEMAQFANITRMAHGDIERYGSAIVNIGNNMATTESKVSSMSQRIAAAGTQTKMSQADILGWAGAMSSLGIEAEAGGTAFSTTISTIDAAVATGGENLERFAKIAGKSSEEFAASWRSNSTQAFQELLSGVDSAENMTLALESMGVEGIRQSDILKRLAGNTDLVSAALKTANDGWNKNSALQSEVDNRNQSLASKFEILKNKVTAVADQVGEPLADALLDAVDAAGPLVEIVENGAEAFSNMSKEEQQTVLKNIAMVASLGPLLTILGKVGTVGGAAVKGIGSATAAFGDFAKKLGEVKDGTTTMSSAFGGLKGGLIGIGVAAATAVAAFAISKWMDYKDKLEKTEKAAMSFRDMEAQVRGELDNSQDALGTAGDGLKTYQGNINDTIGKIDELRENQAKSNDTFINSFKDFTVDKEMLGTYLDTIRELGNSAIPLTAEQQAQLTLAVSGYNDITGDSLEIIDKQKGALSKNTDEVIANTNAFLAQAEIEIYQERIKDAIKERITAEENLVDAQSAQQRAQEYLNQVMEDAALYGEGYYGVLMTAQMELAKCDQAVKDAEAGLRNANTTVKDGTDKVAELTLQQQQLQGATQLLTEKFNTFEGDTRTAFENSGLSIQDFAQKLINAGVNTQVLKDMSEENFQQMYEECNGDVGLMIQKLQEVDKQQFQQKYLEITTNADDVKTKIQKLYDLYSQRLGAPFLGPIMVPQNAAGGIVIPKHADGGIIAHPTLTKAGWVGEAGAEAIIPLTNAKYVSPFARAVAQQMTAGNTDNSRTLQIIIDGDLIANDNEAMRQAAIDFAVEVNRRAGMNRG
ncbi:MULTISPECIES: phage tail tape measure protein [unclassified Adlercreutzia]|uniref:phage tail tape measure protein n=1 Tax=unclassified Adlercreutzia TaxID=2636013 RepID=UPI0013EABBC8|nr:MULTISPECIES: phage tail tape measure protein [unclassified Adlercreutzia]